MEDFAVMSAASSSAEAARASAVAERLSELLGAPASNLRQLSGGASRETWMFELGGERPRALVLQADRLDPGEAPGREPRPRQAPLFEAAANAGVPIAPVVAAGEDDDVLGPAWMVVESVEGTADPASILSGDGVPDAAALLDDMAAALAAVHRMDPDGLGLSAPADPLSELRDTHDELGEPHPVFELAFRELDATRPAPSRRCLVHADFRMGNLLVGPLGVSAVLDWELTHVGDPLEDLGWLCIRAWRFTRPDRPAAGLGSRDELVAAYERHAGVTIDRDALRWWELFGTLRWGVICVIQAFTHLSGAARSLEHAVIGRRACEVEWDLLDLLDPDRAELPRPEPGPPARPLHDRPTAVELLEAVRGGLGDNVLPLLDGRASFELRVALRAIGIMRRELENARHDAALHREALDSLGAEDDAELAARIRAGDFDERRQALLAALRSLVRAKLEAANPRHLEFAEPPEEARP